MPPSYPVTFSVDYPERKLNRLSTFFRIFAVIPIAIVAALLPGAELSTAGRQLRRRRGGIDSQPGRPADRPDAALQEEVPTLVVRLEPRTDALRQPHRRLRRPDGRQYPSTDEQQAVHLDFAYPDAERLERGLPLVKWLLAIPHYIVLFFLYIGVFFAVIGAWFAILFTGRYPRGIFKFVEGTIRWHNRVVGYAFVLVTDDYPPFRLSA